MAMVEHKAYAKRSRACLAEASKELARGDLSQASAKGWDAASLMVKALASERGWEHEGRGDLHKAVGQLRRETSDTELTMLFAMAGELDTNSSEGFLSDLAVRAHIEGVARFVERVETVLTGD